MEQIDIGKLLCAINNAESLMFMLLTRKEDRENLISRIVFNYIKPELVKINNEINKNYGYDSKNMYFMLGKQHSISYDNTVVYNIDTDLKLEDILADFYERKELIAKRCNDKFGNILTSSIKYNDFIDKLFVIINNDTSIKLNKPFSIKDEQPSCQNIFEKEKSNIYNTRCRIKTICYNGIRLEADYDYKLTPNEYWNKYKYMVLSRLALNMLFSISVTDTKLSLTEQKFAINFCKKSNLFRLPDIFSNYKYTCAATKKFLEKNHDVIINKRDMIPEFT